MAKDRVKGSEKETYHFMNETIKKKRMDKKAAFYRAAGVAGCGIIFGVCAAGAMTVTRPIFEKYMNTGEAQKEDVRLITAAPKRITKTEADSSDGGGQEADTLNGKEAGEASSENTGIEGSALIERYNQLYEEVLEISRPVQKALVMVEAVTGREDLLDESLLSFGMAQGFILDIHESYVYILIDGARLPDEEAYRIIFADGSDASAGLCRRDSGTGLAVLKVPADELAAGTIDAIASATFNEKVPVSQAQMVVAVGNFGGDTQTVLYGEITSTEGILSVADAEYQIISTTICGNEESGGVLLDIFGNVVGIITEAGDGQRIEALGIADIFPLIEGMCNQKTVPFVGIIGETVNREESERLNIPQGIYVNSVEKDSPAMTAGIQKGDIIQSVNGHDVSDMNQYMNVLEKLNDKEKVNIKGQRRDAEGTFKEINFKAEIEKR